MTISGLNFLSNIQGKDNKGSGYVGKDTESKKV